MPWKETCTMDERIRFVAAVKSGSESISQLSRLFGISRKTAYKWLDRYAEKGPEGLVELSRARHFHPNATSSEALDLLLELRRARPTWGPRKLIAVLEREWPGIVFPSHSTAAALLHKHGLSQRRRRRAVTPAFAGRLTVADAPNQVWCGDFKGHFALGDKKRCYPLTVTDDHTRYLLRCHAALRGDYTLVREVLRSAFFEYGMPEVFRTDNGPPFATAAPGGLSILAVWLIKLGVRPERIDKGKPTQNGRHERMHRTLKAEAATPPERNRLAQQRRFDVWRADFNDVRPHQAHGQRTPAAAYVASKRRFPEAPRDPLYESQIETVRVRADGVLNWLSYRVPLTELLGNELLGLEEVEEGWDIHFGPVLVGQLSKEGLFKRAVGQR
jgi:transposase InsO family protein